MRCTTRAGRRRPPWTTRSNWGSASQTGVCIEGTTGPDTTPPVPPTIASARLSGTGLADVTITWTASSDEGFLGGTVKYQVFRSASIGGPYAQVGADINGVGLPTYSLVDPNVAPNTFFYYVRSTDGAGLIANSTQTAGRTQFAVAAGMNYLSVPFIQADESLSAVLQTVNVAGAWTFDRCVGGGTWYSWSSQRPAGHNSLQTVSHRVGLIDEHGRRHLVSLDATMVRVAGLGVLSADKLRANLGRRLSVGDRSVLVLPANRRDRMEGLDRKAQVIGPKDAAAILFQADVSPGAVVVEAGVGSAWLTVALAGAVGPR